MKSKKNTTPLTRTALALLCALALAACGKKDDAAKAPTKTEEPPRPVRTMVVGEQALTDALFLPGDVRARHEQRLGFRIGGKIAQRSVEVGQMVKGGQVLAVLDSQDVTPQINTQAAQLEAARANTKWQEADLSRQKDLRDKGFISAAALQRQQINAESARAQENAAASALANARNALTFQTLRADRAGVVIGVDAEVGSVVTAGQSVVRIAQQGEKEVVVNVPERSVDVLKGAKSTMAVVEALDNKKFPAQLRELSPSADALSRTYTARYTIPDDADIHLGMSATIITDLGGTSAIVVPLSALNTRDGNPRVWVVDQATQTVQPVPVTTGALVQDGIRIAQGLKPGQIVVTAGANLLTPGQKVRLITDKLSEKNPAESAKSAPQVSNTVVAPSAGAQK